MRVSSSLRTSLLLLSLLLCLPVMGQVRQISGPSESNDGRLIYSWTGTAATTAVTTEETLASYTLPANALSINDQYVEVEAIYVKAANTNNVTAKLTFGATTLHSRTTAASGPTIEIHAKITRTGAATQYAYTRDLQMSATPAATHSTPAETLSGTVLISAIGKNAVPQATDLSLKSFRVWLHPLGSTGNGPGFTGGPLTADTYPSADNSISLGLQSARWKNFYGSGGVTLGTVAKTSAYTATATDHTIRVDTTSGNVTITLPAAASHTGRIYVIKKVAAANTVTIDANSTETIDGTETQTLTTNYSSYTIQSNGTGWDIL